MERFGETREEETERIRINRSMDGEYFPDTQTIAIHIQKDPGISEHDAIHDISEGFHLLAYLLETKEAYKEVKRIIGTSWILTEHPKIAKRYGFMIDLEGTDPEGMRQKERYSDKGRKKEIARDKRNIPPTFASADRDTFLARWGTGTAGAILAKETYEKRLEGGWSR